MVRTGNTVVFGSMYPWPSQLRLAAALRRRGFRVEHVTGSGDSVRHRLCSVAERLVYHRVTRSVGTEYAASSLRLDDLARSLAPPLLDLQLDDWLASAMTDAYVDHPHFPRRTTASFAERDLYDKTRMTEHASSSGWPVPPTYDPAAFDHDEDSWPRIVKPRLGGGGHGIEVVRDRSELDRVVAGLGGAGAVIVQKFLTGESVRVAGVARHGAVVHAVTYKSAKDPADPYGPSVGLRIVDIPDISSRADAFIKQIGFTGIFGIESIRSPDGEPCFIEMNTRVLASFAALSSAGIDLVEDYLYALGARATPAAEFSGRTDLIEVNAIRVYWRTLGLRWAAAELGLRGIERVRQLAALRAGLMPRLIPARPRGLPTSERATARSATEAGDSGSVMTSG